MDWILIGNYAIAFLLGFVYSFIELLAKYKEAKDIFIISAGWVYLITNGIVSIGAYFLLNQVNLKIDEKPISEATKLIISGISAMAVLRSSVFSVKVNSQQIKGDATPLIQVLLDWVDNKFDQKRAGLRIEAVKRIMKSIDFEKAKLILPDLCIRLMKTLSLDNQKNMGSDVEKINTSLSLEDGKIDANFVKCLKLGIIIAEYAGIGILSDAVDKLKEIISKN